jgi:FkbM family methyltransferase
MLASNIKTVKTRYGEMAYYADDFYIGASLKTYGEYSELEIDFLRRIIEPGWTVIDAGANIGVLTLAFAEMVGADGIVHAFEPQPENYQLLLRNTERIKQINTYDTALGDHEGCIIAPPLATLQHRNYGRVELGGDFGDTVRLTKLDTLLLTKNSTDNRDIVELIKIDVEGMEVEVLKGATELIKLNRPVLYVENDRSERSRELLELLKSWDYECFSHNPPVYNPDNFNKAPRDPKFEYVSINLLAIPKEQLDDYADVIAELRPSKPPGPKRRVDAKAWAGFARMGGVGDNLIAASVCRPLKDLGYMVEVISQEPMAELYINNPHIDKLSVYGKDDWPQDQNAWQQWFAMRSKEYDRFVNLSHSGEALHAAFPGMTQFWWPEKFRRKLFGGSYLESTHDLLGVPHTFSRLFWPTEEEVDWAAGILSKVAVKPIVGWVICGTRLDKVYPYQQQTIARLIKEAGVSVVMTGRGPGTPDFEIAAEIMKMVTAQNGTVDGLYHIGQGPPTHAPTKLRNVLSLLQQCDLVVGPDTGPMWAVAMEPIPKIMLHSHASVENITKHWVNTVSLHADPKQVSCWPCHRLHNDKSTCRMNEHDNGAACISNIAPDTVIAAARKLLGTRHA